MCPLKSTIAKLGIDTKKYKKVEPRVGFSHEIRVKLLQNMPFLAMKRFSGAPLVNYI